MNFIFVCRDQNLVFESDDFSILENKGVFDDGKGNKVLDKIKTGQEKEIIVLVDTDTSKENVTRAAESQGCHVNDVSPEGEGYRVTIKKD